MWRGRTKATTRVLSTPRDIRSSSPEMHIYTSRVRSRISVVLLHLALEYWSFGGVRPQVYSYFAALGTGAKYRDLRVCLSVCLFVWLSVRSHISKTHVQISLDFLFMLPVAVARSSCDGSAIRYVLPVLWMTSCFRIMEGIGPNQRRRVCFVEFAKWRHRGRSLLPLT